MIPAALEPGILLQRGDLLVVQWKNGECPSSRELHDTCRSLHDASQHLGIQILVLHPAMEVGIGIAAASPRDGMFIEGTPGLFELTDDEFRCARDSEPCP